MLSSLRAIEQGDLDQLQQLVETGLDLRQTLGEKDPLALCEDLPVCRYLVEEAGYPLHLRHLESACRRGRLAIVRYLCTDERLSSMAQPQTLFRMAEEDGHLSVMEFLATELPMDSLDRQVLQIWRAAVQGDLETLSAAEIRSEWYPEMLELVIRYGQTSTLIHYLRTQPELFTGGDEYLIQAAWHGRTEIVDHLWAGSLAVRAEAEEALSVAIGHGHLETVRQLLRLRATVDGDPHQERSTPAELAFPGRAPPDWLGLFRYLEEMGVPLRYGTVTGTAAAAIGDLHLLQYLLDRWPCSERDRDSCLLAAVREGHLEVVQWLSKPGAGSWLAISQACRQGHLPVLQYLMAQRPVEYPMWCLTPAVAAGRRSIVEWILHEHDHPEECLREAFQTACRVGSIELAEILVHWVSPDVGKAAWMADPVFGKLVEAQARRRRVKGPGPVLGGS